GPALDGRRVVSGGRDVVLVRGARGGGVRRETFHAPTVDAGTDERGCGRGRAPDGARREGRGTGGDHGPPGRRGLGGGEPGGRGGPPAPAGPRGWPRGGTGRRGQGGGAAGPAKRPPA